MNVLAVLFALELLVWGAEFQATAEDNQGVISKKVINGIEGIRDQMPCGFSKFGIPPLAPFETAHQEIGIDTKDIQAFGEVSDFILNGLDDFEINKLKINLLLSRANFKFNWNNVYLLTHYNVSTARNGKGLRRNGPAQFAVKDFTAWGVVKYHYGLISRKLIIKELRVYVSLGEVKSEIDGLSENNVVNQKLNRIIEELIMMTVNENSDKVAELTNSMLVPRLNDILSKKPLPVLLNMMNVDVDDESPASEKEACTPPQQDSD